MSGPDAAESALARGLVWASEADRIAFEQDVLLTGTGYFLSTADGRKIRIAPEAVTVRKHLETRDEQ